MREINGDRAPECADEAMRDALPALDHGRLPGSERRAVEAHLAVCASCVEELALLRDVRTSLTAAAPSLDLDRLARAVAASTRVATAEGAEVIPLAPRLAARQAPARRLWMRAGGLRAAAAAMLIGGGVGAVTLARRGDQPVATGSAPASVVAAGAATRGAGAAEPSVGSVATANTPAAAGAAPARAAHVLGQPFDDLSDAELDAVLLAIDDADAELPALEPAVHASEYREGGGA
jgi:anti-sigma factor RsiW